MTSRLQPGIWHDLGRIYGHMSPVRRRQFYRLIGLMFAGAFAELATIGSVVPFLSLLSNPGAFTGFRTASSQDRRGFRSRTS